MCLFVLLLLSLCLFFILHPPTHHKKDTPPHVWLVFFSYPHLLACSFLSVKRNKLLTHPMLIPSHYLPLSLFLFLSKKEQVSLLKHLSFFAHPSIALFLFMHKKEQVSLKLASFFAYQQSQ